MRTREQARYLRKISEKYMELVTLSEHVSDPALLKTAVESLANAVDQFNEVLREEIE